MPARVPMLSREGVITVPVHVAGLAKKQPYGVPSEFTIPQRLAADPLALDEIIGRTAELARAEEADEDDLAVTLRAFVNQKGYVGEDSSRLVSNFLLLRWLTRIRRDSVWTFILRNAYRPAYFAQRKFDYVMSWTQSNISRSPWSESWLSHGDSEAAVIISPVT